MSRSRRKNPFHGITTCQSEKIDKRLANRRLRKINRQRLAEFGGEVDMADIRDVSNVWCFGKDGKTRFVPDPDDDPEWHETHERIMRK